jgi:hypothetical protein
MRYTLSVVDLLHADLYVPDEFGLLHHPFILANVEKYSRTPAVLSDNDWALRLMNLIDESSEI